MPRIARVIIPSVAHHFTQRGNRRQTVFFSDQDKNLYLKILLDQIAGTGLRVMGYCLMTNHVHHQPVPQRPEDIARIFGETHRKYSSIINIREKWRGHLWQERFWSFPMDEAYQYRAIRYSELNPVRAGIVKKAEDYPWSSARCHLGISEDPIVSTVEFAMSPKEWADFLREGEEEIFAETLRWHSRTGRPLGGPEFVSRLEILTGRSLMRKKSGPRRRPSPADIPEL
jgi:putative transposase